MKKILIGISVFVFNFLAISNAQSFQKGSLIATVGFGYDIYSINETFSLNGAPNISTTYSGEAGCASYPIYLEYGVNNWLGLGLEGKFDNYFIKKDSTTGYQPTAYGFEFGLVVNFHIVRTQHIDFFLGLNLGTSHFTYTLDSYSDQVYGSGGWGDIHAGLRYYFGRFGLNTYMGFPTMTYNLTGNNANWSLGQNILSTWKAHGVSFGLGFQYRILK